MFLAYLGGEATSRKKYQCYTIV